MSKRDIYSKLKELYPKMSLAEVKLLADKLFHSMYGALVDNNRIEVRGFGVFNIKSSERTVTRNPRHNTIIAEHTVVKSVHFKPGKDLKLKVNKGLPC